MRYVTDEEDNFIANNCLIKHQPEDYPDTLQKKKPRAPINTAEVIQAIREGGDDGVTVAYIEKALDCKYQQFNEWFNEHGAVNNILKTQKPEGTGFVYKLGANS